MAFHAYIPVQPRLSRCAFALLLGGAFSLAACQKMDSDAPAPQAAGADASAVVTRTRINSSVDLTRPGLTVPPHFLGFSLEHQNIVSFFAGYRPGNAVTPAFLQLLNNLKTYQTRGLILRIGGDSSDEAWWNPTGAAKPRGISIDYTDRELSILKNVVDGAGAKVIFGLNFGQNNPNLAIALGQQAQQKLGNSLLFQEIGNEPDLYYTNKYPGGGTVRPSSYNYSTFFTEYKRFLAALKAGGIQRMAAPAATTYDWMNSFTQSASFDQVRDQVQALTYHRYPYSASTVTISKILRDSAASYLAAGPTGNGGVKPMVARAAGYGRPLYLSEVGSAAVGGKDGVSNTFASALWGLDVMFNMANVGVAGMQFHTTDAGFYSPFQFRRAGGASGTFTPVVHPFYYAMLLFAQATTNEARLLPVSFNTPSNVKVWATLDKNGVVRVVGINKTANENFNIKVTLSAVRPAGTVVTLKAPALDAKTGVSLAGQTFDGSSDGTIQGSFASIPIQAVDNAVGTKDYFFNVDRNSAALLTIAP